MSQSAILGPALWGATFAAAIYLIGNGMWVNRWARNRLWIGWLAWMVSGMLIVIAGAAIENHFGSGSSIAGRLGSVDIENHWIALALYALLSVPGAACVILKQDIRWTRLAMMSIALVLFIPAGLHLGEGVNQGAAGSLPLGLGLAGAVCGLLWLWQATLDCEPTTIVRS
ncbi:MAG: hypothetical protein R8J84_05605 [Mariprofundales bacterium]